MDGHYFKGAKWRVLLSGGGHDETGVSGSAHTWTTSYLFYLQLHLQLD